MQDCVLCLSMETRINATYTSWESSSSTNHRWSLGDEVKLLLTVLYSMISVVGFIGNALVVWVITVGVKLKSMTDVCLLNLALADLLLVLSLPFRVYEMNHHWMFGNDMCSLVFGVYYVGFYAGIFFVVLMSIDRYLVIVHAVFTLGVRTKTRAIVASLVTWILAVASCFPELSKIRDISSEVICSSFLSHDLFIIAMFKRNILSLLALCIIGFCYSMILWRLQRSHSPKKHSMYLVVLVMVVFFCCWTPFNITILLQGLHTMGLLSGDSEVIKRIQLTYLFTKALAFSHSCLNPFLYVFVGEKFRKHLFRLIRKHRSIYCS